MQITVKTTQNKIHKIDVEPADTVGQLKAKIEAAHGYSAATQKVIYSGKILPDDKTIESCGVKEKDFFVLMPKPTPTPKPQLPSTSTAVEVLPPTTTSTSSTNPAAPTTSIESPAPAVSGTSPATSTPTSSTPGNNDGFLTGEGLQSAINSLVEMGFPRDEVYRAMRASFNNPDRAVEYLTTGYPRQLAAEAARPASQAPTVQPNPSAVQVQPSPPATRVQPTQPSANPTSPAPAAQTSNQPQNLFQLAQQQQQQQRGGGGGTGAIGGSIPGGGLGLGALQGNLQDNPSMASLRDAIARNPELGQSLIQQLDPRLADLLAQHPGLLLQALGGMEGEGDDGEGGEIPPGAQVVSVTPEDREAIQRLEALGFSRQAVIEAYFACDKNEELAANYLFESSFDD